MSSFHSDQMLLSLLRIIVKPCLETDEVQAGVLRKSLMVSKVSMTF
jgi:hypothetical protein